MSRSLSTIAARWCKSRCAAILLVTPFWLPASAAIAQGAGGFRASQMMSPRMAQMSPSMSRGGEPNVIYDGPSPAPSMYGSSEISYGGCQDGSCDNGWYADGCGGDYCDGCGGAGCDSCGGGCGGGCSSCCDPSCGGCGNVCDIGPTYCQPCVTVYAEWLYLNVWDADIAHARQEDLDEPFGEVGTLEYDYDSGYRFGASVACGDCSSIVVSYSAFETDADDDLDPPGTLDGEVGSLVQHPDLNITGSTSTVEAESEIEFELADALYRYRLAGGCNHSVNVLVGAQYGRLEQEFAQFGDFQGDEDGQMETATDIDFEGAGVKAGLEAERRMGGGFGAYGRLTAAALAGEFESEYALFNFDQDEFLTEVEWDDNRFVQQVEYELGLNWLSPRQYWRISAGYMVSHWFNVVTTSELVNAVRNDHFVDVGDTISFAGAVGRVEFCW